MWDVIVLIPDHCLSIYFASSPGDNYITRERERERERASFNRSTALERLVMHLSGTYD